MYAKATISLKFKQSITEAKAYATKKNNGLDAWLRLVT